MRPNAGKRVAVIGAGPSGLTAIKNLRDAGLTDIVCYEATDAIGGNWVFRDGPSVSSVYETTKMISSKWLSSFEGFPMPRDYPQFPSHQQILAYFHAYAERFALKPHIRLSARVELARRQADGRWRLTIANGTEIADDIVDALLVCTGHHADPLMPELPGRFAGELLHSHDFKRAAPFRGKRVLVIGGGNSACDIAVETARVSAATAISMRRGYCILPKTLFGVPIDLMFWPCQFLRKPARRAVAELMYRYLVGGPARYGLAEPDSAVLEMHPTLNSDMLTALRRGAIAVRPAIAGLDGAVVHFADGVSESFDTIVAATGYRITFPFLAEPFNGWAEVTPPPLYLRMMPADIDNLFFIGLFQPQGCIWSLSDYQARIAALLMTGRLPRPRDLAARIAHEVGNPHWRYQRSRRHAIEVDFHEFRRSLRTEIARAERASLTLAGDAAKIQRFL